MVSKTRKTSKNVSKDILTVPDLRRSFERIDRFVESKVLRLSEKEGVQAFRKEWKKVFGQIGEQAAKDYLQFMRANKGQKQKQKGGAVTVLSPAPVGYDLRGGEPNVSVPPYVAGGMAPPADSLPQAGGVFLPPAADLGSNEWVPQKGGRRRGKKTRRSRQKGGALPSFGTAFAEFTSRPLGMSSPPTASQDLQMTMKGYTGFASPRPEINNMNFPRSGTVFNAAISPVSSLF